MGFYDEFGDKLVVSEQKRKARLALEEKLKDSAMRYQNGTFDLKVFDGEGTYARPFKIRITRKNFDEDIIVVHENEGYGYKTQITNTVYEILHQLKNYIQDKLEVEFFRIYFR